MGCNEMTLELKQIYQCLLDGWWRLPKCKITPAWPLRLMVSFGLVSLPIQCKTGNSIFIAEWLFPGKKCLETGVELFNFLWGSGTKYSPGRRHNRCDLNKKRMRQKNQEVANINLSDFWIYTHLSYKNYKGNSVINYIN